jgi:hypothetical protein
MTHNPYTPPEGQVQEGARVPDAGSTEVSGPVGLGGWLVLVCIGLVVTIARTLLHHGQTFVPLFANGTWDALTTPGAESYHPLWMPLLCLEIVWNVASISFCIYLLVLFFRKSRLFPRLYMVLLAASVVFILLDAWLVTLVLPDEPMLDPETTKELGRSLITSLIWIPYMLRSIRVKNTFAANSAA